MNKRTAKVAKKIYELKEAGKPMQEIALEIEYSLMYCYRLYEMYRATQIDKDNSGTKSK